MRVEDIVKQFTHMNFTLIVEDTGYYGELYNGPAREVFDDPACGYLVIAMEPPRRANEVILYVDVDEKLGIDSYELFADDL